MVDVFEFNNYLEFLVKLVDWRHERGQTRAELAQVMGCQAAYFSQVLKGRVELTEDHAIKLCAFLGFSEDQTDYFLLILRKARAATPELSKYLETRRKRVIDRRRKVEERVASEKRAQVDESTLYYCSDWLPSCLHLATSSDRFQTRAALAKRFEIAEDLVDFHLRELEKHGFVAFEGGRWKFVGRSIHFPKSSPLDLQFQTSRRLLGMNSLSRRNTDDLHYSAILGTDAETFRAVKERLLETIEELHRTVEPSPSEDVYTVSLDFFRA